MWVSFGATKRLKCDLGLASGSSYKWWSGTGCEPESYQLMAECTQNECRLNSSHYGSSALNYCCTPGSALSFSPSSSSSVRCYSLSSELLWL